MLRKLCFSFLLLVHKFQSEKTKGPIEMRILKTGSNVSIECEACNVASRQWTYTSFNGSYVVEDLTKGNDIIRNKLIGKGDFRYNITTKHANCTYNLLITAIKLNDAGVFACCEGAVVLKSTNIAIVDTHDMCSSDSEFPYSKDIHVKQNDSVTITCSFQYSADESCIVTPIWTDLTGYRDLKISDDDFEVNMDDKHACIHFKHSADLRNGTNFFSNLSFAFNCSFLNQDKLIRYDFGQIHFTIFTDDKNRNIELNLLSRILTVTWSMCAVLVITSATVALLLVWRKYSKFVSGNRTHNEAIAEGEHSSEMNNGYSGVREDLTKDIKIYEVINSGIYEIAERVFIRNNVPTSE